MKWDVTEMNSISWDQLSISLTGSKTMKHRDVPQYLFPALCLASEMMMRHAKEPKGMINFFEECKAQIESAFGEGVEAFLVISGERDTASGMPAPPGECRRQLRVKDYTAEETEYIHLIWETTANTFQPVDRADAIDEGRSSAVANIARHLRPRAARDSREAAQADLREPEPSIGSTSTSITERSRLKKRAYVKTISQSSVTDHWESRVVSSDRGRTRGRGRKRGMPGGQTEAARLDVPLSPATCCMLLGRVSLNLRFLSETCEQSAFFRRRRT
jgi:hypothetical protein